MSLPPGLQDDLELFPLSHAIVKRRLRCYRQSDHFRLLPSFMQTRLRIQSDVVRLAPITDRTYTVSILSSPAGAHRGVRTAQNATVVRGSRRLVCLAPSLPAFMPHLPLMIYKFSAILQFSNSIPCNRLAGHFTCVTVAFPMHCQTADLQLAHHGRRTVSSDAFASLDSGLRTTYRVGMELPLSPWVHPVAWMPLRLGLWLEQGGEAISR